MFGGGYFRNFTVIQIKGTLVSRNQVLDCQLGLFLSY